MKGRFKILKIAAIVLLPLMLVAGGILYLRLYGFERALEELVSKESNGQYTLTIDGSFISLRELSFELTGLTVSRNPNAPDLGIRSVTVPFVRLRFGSVLSMYRVGQFDIETLIIDEPQIEMDAPPSKDKTQQVTVNVTEQILRLYPAIESILKRFNIQSFSIQRASVELDKVAHPTLRLGLIDLLIQHWNIQQLTKESQLQLKIGKQGLDLGKTSLHFEGVEFNFQKHFLRFTDFLLESHDSITNSQVNVAGASLMLQHLNYKELYENQRYMLERAEVDSVVVTANLKLDQQNKKARRRAAGDDRDVVSRILKQTFGECSIDSTLIRNAQVHLTLHKDNDSIQVDLPHIDFRLHSFQVVEDSNRFLIGALEVNLRGTALTLHKNLAVHFNKISFDENQNLVVTDVKVADGTSRKNQIASIGRLQMEYFDLMLFVFNKKFYANAVRLEDADIDMTRAVPATRGGGKPVMLADLKIATVSVKNSRLQYADEHKTLSAQGVSADVRNVHLDTAKKVRFHIEAIKLRNGRMRNPARKIDSRIRGIDFDGRILRADHIDLRRDSLAIEIRNIFAEAESEVTTQGFRHWKKMELSNLSVKGRLPHAHAPAKHGHREEHHVKVDTLKIHNLTTDVALAGKEVSFRAQNIAVTDIVSGAEGFQWDRILGTLADVQVKTPAWQARVDRLQVNYPTGIRMSGTSFSAHETEVSLKNLSVHSIQKDNNAWQLRKVLLSDVTVNKNQEPVFHSDSVQVMNTVIHPNELPTIARVEVFHPRITRKHASEKKKSVSASAKLPIPDRMIIHPGEAHLPDNKIIEFGVIDINQDKGTMGCAFIHTATEKMHLRVYDIQLKNRLLTLDSVTLRSRPEWFVAHPVEDDVINASLRRVSVKGFILDSLLQHHRVRDLAVELSDFSMDIKRDKRQEDPPIKEKPVTLNELLRLPPVLNIHTLDVKSGTIRYAETSDKTEETGTIMLNRISAALQFDKRTHNIRMHATTSLYNSGTVNLDYETMDANTFTLDVRVKDFALTNLNQMVTPLQAVRIKSGNLLDYRLNVVADRDHAVGQAEITYKDLHLEILKKKAEKKGLGAEILTFVADGLILKHSREQAVVDVNQQRIKHKSVFNYWVKAAGHGAMNAIRKGKRRRSPNV